MDMFEQAFLLLPDTVIITDAYWYILDFNHSKPFEQIRKGSRLTCYMPDCVRMQTGKLRRGGRVYQQSVTAVYENNLHVGYAVYLSDITDRENLIEQRRRKSAELKAMTQRQKQANEELEAYVRQAEALSVYEEQLRIARVIHDDAGHAITTLNTISQMCLQLGRNDPEQYGKLIDEGLSLCENGLRENTSSDFASVLEMLKDLRNKSPFPVILHIEGEEPPFAGALHDVISRLCNEAYHNTLAHSLADSLSIDMCCTPETLKLRVSDNGSFRGKLVKGFGLTTMEENVRASGGEITFIAEEGKGFEIVAEWRTGQ